MTHSEISDSICTLIDERTDLISMQCFEYDADRAIDIIDLELRIESLQIELYYN